MTLLCFSQAANPINISHTSDIRFRHWLFAKYNFTVMALWSPFLVKYRATDSKTYLYLNEADSSWASQIKHVHILVVSGGQWFFRPVASYDESKNTIQDLGLYDSFRMAFRGAFRPLLRKFKGVTFLRTYSPSHFEHGGYVSGGYCNRTRPFTREEMKLDGYVWELYKTQVKEFRDAERRGKERGLKFGLLDITQAMVLRPDGHPNHYGPKKGINDCLHWCLPGPVDTWNEFLLHMLKEESENG